MGEVIPVVLAAGRGSRLNVDSAPKPMVLIDGKPLMQYALRSLSQIGFGTREVIAVVGHKKEVIQGYFGGDLKYCLQDILNGNAGALELVIADLGEVQEKHILTIHGDDSDQATPDNLRDLIYFHMSRHADISILTVNNPDPVSHRVEYISDNNGRVTEMIPRKSMDAHGRYTAGIYLFSGPFLEKFLPVLKLETPEGEELKISKLIDLAIKSCQRVFQFCSHDNYISVNTLRGLERLRERRMNQ